MPEEDSFVLLLTKKFWVRMKCQFRSSGSIREHSFPHPLKRTETFFPFSRIKYTQRAKNALTISSAVF